MKTFKRLTSALLILLVIFQSIDCLGSNKTSSEKDSGLKISRSKYNWDAEILNKALNARLVQWENDPVVNTEYTAFGVLISGKALNYLALVAFHDSKNQHPEVAAKVVEQLRYVISGGKEPCCRGVIAGWADNPLAQSIALAKFTKSVWGKLTKDEIKKLDLLMSSMAIAGNYCHNSQNSITRGLYQAFDWRKGWNPNHVEGYVGVMAAAWIYFGGSEAVNSIFRDFNYDDYMRKLESNGFVNIRSCWSASGKTLMETGGTDAGGGTTKGVKMPFRYSSLSGYGELDYDPFLLYRDLAARMYKFQVTSTGCDGACYILDGTKSPYEGQNGMCYEFNTVDASGCRSSVGYCFEGWWNDVLTAATLQSFGLIPEGAEKQDIIARRDVGSGDLMYKLQHGYRDHKNGKSSDASEKNVIGLGYPFIKDVYLKMLKVK
jgi:hypothetical protein